MLNNPVSEPQVPQEITRDNEAGQLITAAISAHTSAADPHTQYLNQSRGDARYRQTATALTDSDIPAGVARDSEVTAAISAHASATDPHPVYLTQTEGDTRYRQTSTPLTDSDIPSAIARDTEVTAAINGHLAATDPHAQYLTQAEADGLYRQNSVAYFSTAPLPAGNVAGNSIAFGWNSVQPGQGIAEICNYAGLGGGDAFNFFRMPGNPTTSPTLSNRVSRIDISGSYVQTSDERVKSDFSSAPGLEAVLKLQPARYNHWSCAGFSEEEGIIRGNFSITKIGFVAQEVQKIIPEAVSIPSSREELWGIDYNCLLACAVQAIQDLNFQLNRLKEEVAELRKKVNS